MSNEHNDKYIEQLIEDWKDQQSILLDDQYCRDEPAEAFCAEETCDEIEKELRDLGVDVDKMIWEFEEE